MPSCGAYPSSGFCISGKLWGAHLGDVDNDNDIDMLLHFRIQEAGIQAGDTEATHTGETVGGQVFAGTDTVNIVP